MRLIDNAAGCFALVERLAQKMTHNVSSGTLNPDQLNALFVDKPFALHELCVVRVIQRCGVALSVRVFL